MARGDGDDGGSHGDDGGGIDSAHARMIFFAAVDRGHGWGRAWWRAALHYAGLHWAGLLAVLQLQQAGVASAFASGLAPPTPEQVAFRAKRAVSER